MEGLHIPGVPKDGSWKKAKPSGSFAGSWMIFRVLQICPRDVISAGLNQGCQREPCEQHLGLATNSPRAGTKDTRWIYNQLQGWQLGFLQFESRSHQEGAKGGSCLDLIPAFPIWKENSKTPRKIRPQETCVPLVPKQSQSHHSQRQVLFPGTKKKKN